MIIGLSTIKDLLSDDAMMDKIIAALNLPMSYFLKPEYDSKSLIRSYIKDFRNDVVVIIEDEYVDKVYRNIYSCFLSTKLYEYKTRCVKLSFIESTVDVLSILNGSIELDALYQAYLGFMVLRPICPGTVGRTAISPRLLTYGNRLEISAAPIIGSVLGNKIEIEAFPHSSQDNEYCTCAETSIWSMLEYFGNKYPEYSPILPSKIHQILDSQMHQRHIPSYGLNYVNISYVLKTCGFGCKVYSRALGFSPGFGDEEFYRIFSTYVESGVPMVTAVSGERLGHAIVCVGQERIDKKSVASAKDNVFHRSGKSFKMWNDVMRRFVFNDDNVGAYALTQYDCPTPQYVKYNPVISSLIVPLNNKLYLDAPRAIEWSIALSDDILFKLPDNMVLRAYLASGRSYRNGLMKDRRVPDAVKMIITQYVQMPKFVWITEISSYNSFIQDEVEGIILLDATEPMKLGVGCPLMAVFDRNFKFFSFKTSEFKELLLPLQFKATAFDNLRFC